LIKSNDGYSYYGFYRKVASSDDFPEVPYLTNIENLIKIKPNEYNSTKCLQKLIKIKKKKVEKSKSYLLTLKMNEITANGEFSPSIVAGAITSILSPSDFDKYYYKAKALLTIAHISSYDEYTSNNLNSERTFEDKEFLKVSVQINERNEIVYNDEIINGNTLKNELYSFIKQNPNNHLIMFTVEKETLYNFYLDVHSNISDVYSKLRNEKSKEIFERQFSDLTDKEKEEIEEIYPENITEG